MLPHHPFGDHRHHSRPEPLPTWLLRDFDGVPFEPEKRRRLKIPVWPGFRLSIFIERTTPVGGTHV